MTYCKGVCVTVCRNPPGIPVPDPDNLGEQVSALAERSATPHQVLHRQQFDGVLGVALTESILPAIAVVFSTAAIYILARYKIYT